MDTKYTYAELYIMLLYIKYFYNSINFYQYLASKDIYSSNHII
jgi:hypothetical protein